MATVTPSHVVSRYLTASTLASKRPPSISKDDWLEAVKKLADDAIWTARENVDVEFAISMIEHDPGPWRWDAGYDGKFWTRPALVAVMGREPTEVENSLWLQYLRSVYAEVAKILLLKKVASLVKAKPLSAKAAKEMGLPDFKSVAVKAIELGKKFASENWTDFRDYGEKDAALFLGDMGPREAIAAAFGPFFDLGNLDPIELRDALVADADVLLSKKLKLAP
jgi:hypothetical protein